MLRRIVWSVVAVLAACTAAPGSLAPEVNVAAEREPIAGWSLETEPSPAVVGQRAGVWLEYVPPSSRVDPARALSRLAQMREIAWTAHCVSCSAPPVTGVVTAYDVKGPDDVARKGAAAAFDGPAIFPVAGRWRVEPFGVELDVRRVAAHEPPFVHVRRWSEPLPDGCTPDVVADLLRTFADAYSAGDAARLRQTVKSGMDFSIAGGTVPLVARDRDAFLAVASRRHVAQEKLVIHRVHLALAHPGSTVGMAVEATRTAADLPPPGQRLSGKGALWCEQRSVVSLYLAVVRAPTGGSP